ncbi:MAG: GAF domain-containing protein, partial [Pseudomonadota bacterium]
MSEALGHAEPEKVDLTTCDREPIQFLGQVQGFGCLIAVSSDWMILHASRNCADILGLEIKELIGARFVDFFPRETVHALRTRLQALVHEDAAARVYGLDLFGDGRLVDVSIHRSGRSVVFEFEMQAKRRASRDDAGVVQTLMARVRAKSGTDAFLPEAARCLRALVGMDRVMVYRFDEDGSGVVVAEAVNGALEPYLGLRYPASDIPKQARALYRRSPFRIIADVDGPTFAVEPQRNAAGEPFDLSLAVTRSVSPIHLEYLRNMGVGASMSASILRRGELWGLFACHHREAFHLDFERRSAVELFVQLFNYELAQAEMDREIEDLEKAQRFHDRIMSRMSGGETLIDGFETFAEEIAEVIPADGIAVYTNDRYQADGSAPTEEEFLRLARFLNTAQTSEILSIDRLEGRYDGAAELADRVAGLLAVPISRTPRDYLVLFRREIAQSVTWAGDPEKPVELGPNGARLTPRKSFEAWREVVRGKSAPW